MGRSQVSVPARCEQSPPLSLAKADRGPFSSARRPPGRGNLHETSPLSLAAGAWINQSDAVRRGAGASSANPTSFCAASCFIPTLPMAPRSGSQQRARQGHHGELPRGGIWPLKEGEVLWCRPVSLGMRLNGVVGGTFASVLPQTAIVPTLYARYRPHESLRLLLGGGPPANHNLAWRRRHVFAGELRRNHSDATISFQNAELRRHTSQPTSRILARLPKNLPRGEAMQVAARNQR